MNNFDNFLIVQKLIWAGEPDFDKAEALVKWLAMANAALSTKNMTPEQKEEFVRWGKGQVAAALKDLANG